MAGVCELLLFCQLVGVCEFVAVLSGGQWLVCVSCCGFCQEANGWRVLIDCCSVRRPKAGVCELIAFLSGG